jgi:voltage-gated sodium channel
MQSTTPVVPMDSSCVSSEKAPLAPSEAWADRPCENRNGDDAAAQRGGSKERPSSAQGRGALGGDGGMFEYTDSEAMKQKVRNDLLRPDPYDVIQFYKESGIWQFLARHKLFENVTLAVIAFNAVWIAVDTDWNKTSVLTDSAALFQVMEHFFCTFFTCELFVRFMAFKRKLNGLKDAWFVFDSMLVIFMVLETWVFTIMSAFMDGDAGTALGGTSLLRLLRLFRLSRLLRMLRSLPELMILIKGMITAMKSVLYVMCLLGIILYVFAIAFTVLAADTATIRDRYFQNVLLSMYSLLIYGTFLDDLSQFCDDIRNESIPILILVFLFICLSALTVMNMLIGVLCEVVASVAAYEKEMILTQTVSEKMQGILGTLDTNSNGMISFVEFKQILDNKQALKALEEVGVDPPGVVDFAEMMFFEDSDPDKPREIPFDKFMEMILDLRSSNTAKVKDIKYLWRQMSPKVVNLNKDIIDMRDRADKLQGTMDQVLQELKKLGGTGAGDEESR